MYSNPEASVRIGSDYNAEGGISCNISEVMVHPLYNNETLDYDIAVVILDGNIMNSTTAQPIALPEDSWQIHIDEEAIVSGFGKSHVSPGKTSFLFVTTFN